MKRVAVESWISSVLLITLIVCHVQAGRVPHEGLSDQRQMRKLLALRQLLDSKANPAVTTSDSATQMAAPPAVTTASKQAAPAETTAAPPAVTTASKQAAPAETTASKQAAPAVTVAPPDITTAAAPAPVAPEKPADTAPAKPADSQSGTSQGGQSQPYWPQPASTGESDGKCLNSEFECVKTMKCILKTQICDGNVDCDYNEDESDCAKKTCDDKGMFTCANKVCTPKEARCNGYDECGDGSDEVNCLNITCEERNMFKCGLPDSPPPFRCGYLPMRCDGQDDCGDGAQFGGISSDEQGCEWVPCGKYRYRCGAGKPTCISGLSRCDGIQDCWDNSDENATTCTGYQCQANWFMCQKGRKRCVEQSSQCDRKVDCDDMSDEQSCYNRPCRDNEFHCVGDKMCLHIRRACNGYPDCGDQTDEDPQMCAKLRGGSSF